MGNKKARKTERYSIIISSLTDARKKSFILSITKRTIICGICVVFAAVTVAAGVAILTATQAVSSIAEAGELKAQTSDQAVLIDSYTAKLDGMQFRQAAYANAIDTRSLTEAQEGAVLLALGNSTQQQDPPLAVSTSIGDTLISLEPSEGSGIKAISQVQSIPMTEAIKHINKRFQARIQEQIEAIKAKEEFDEVEIEYDGDMDGDSYAVNNWADVLSIYAATTMRNELRFLTITPENLEQLDDIYNEMNQLSFYTRKVPSRASDSEDATGILATKLVIYVTVNSLTYSEGAEFHKLDTRQKNMLELLMSPNYYTYFADLLGIDVFDGMRSEDLQQIISSLPEGTKGAEIVKTALIRLGHPYSRSKRGSGNYVDCSYFTYWVYNQNGISIPTSSVEQAKYCYFNGYTIDKDDLKPGDLVYWSKKTCNCGRWKEIHHAGIYIGNDKVIEASSSKGRVIIRSLWNGSEWRIALFARPYSEEAAPDSLPQE